ncbi:DUF3080 family protein [Oceanobacter mangrovi]|uniref:DUF3080 family protein n=1 Tax=Oceanobacter mangrovi TaxID=2862510 RepID=UPI001C8D264B|nr:DUF3080 family protein [Oceanobacter mangrovi]
MIVLVSAGCSQDPVDQLRDYPTRLARTLELELPELAVVAVAPMLTPRQLQLPLQPQSASLLDFLALGRCQLGTVVAEGNSSLGKVAGASQQMHQQRDFILQAPACIEQLQAANDHQLADKLGQVLQQKQQQRLTLWWNAWFGSEEWRLFSSVSADLQPWQPGDDGYQSAALTALDYAIALGRNWQQQDWNYDAAEMEHQLQQLLLSEGLGRWLRTQQWLTAQLQQLTALLEQRQRQRPLCPRGHKTVAAEILQNVVVKFYVGEFQPYMSRNDRFGGELLPRLQQLLALMSADSPSNYVQTPQWQQLQRLAEQLQSTREAFQQASRNHVRAISQTLAACGMSPAG